VLNLFTDVQGGVYLALTIELPFPTKMNSNNLTIAQIYVTCKI